MAGHTVSVAVPTRQHSHPIYVHSVRNGIDERVHVTHCDPGVNHQKVHLISDIDILLSKPVYVHPLDGNGVGVYRLIVIHGLTGG